MPGISTIGVGEIPGPPGRPAARHRSWSRRSSFQARKRSCTVPLGPLPSRRAVGVEPQCEGRVGVLGERRPVPGVTARRRAGPPQEPRSDAALVLGHRRAGEIGAQRQQVGRRLDPRRRRDVAVADRRRRQVGGVHRRVVGRPLVVAQRSSRAALLARSGTRSVHVPSPAPFDPLVEVWSLGADRRIDAVTGQDDRRVREREQPRLDRRDDRREVGVVELRVAGATGEQRVAGEQQWRAADVERDRARACGPGCGWRRGAGRRPR